MCIHPPPIESRTCLTFVWFVTMSTVKKCPPVLFPIPGNMTCQDTVEPFAFGSRCNFTCKEGFHLSGETSLSCLATGAWSGPLPECTGGSHLGKERRLNINELKQGGFKSDQTKCLSLGRWTEEFPLRRGATRAPVTQSCFKGCNLMLHNLFT